MLEVANPNTLDTIIRTDSIAIGSILIIGILIGIKIWMNKQNNSKKKVKPKKK